VVVCAKLTASQGRDLRVEEDQAEEEEEGGEAAFGLNVLRVKVYFKAFRDISRTWRRSGTNLLHVRQIWRKTTIVRLFPGTNRTCHTIYLYPSYIQSGRGRAARAPRVKI